MMLMMPGAGWGGDGAAASEKEHRPPPISLLFRPAQLAPDVSCWSEEGPIPA